ncbi:MAG: aconitate hydratase, partial [Bacillota bacterium]|nr:aconitate hydratase [Bacillota bacterium]
NHGIIPMIFESPEDYDKLELSDELEFENLLDQIPTKRILVKDKTKNISFYVKLDMSENEIEVILSGGQLSYLKKQLQEQNN